MPQHETTASRPGTPAVGRVDHDLSKGATEDPQPAQKGASHPGLDDNGLPNDPTAIAQDRVGANVDKTQG